MCQYASRIHGLKHLHLHLTIYYCIFVGYVDWILRIPLTFCILFSNRFNFQLNNTLTQMHACTQRKQLVRCALFGIVVYTTIRRYVHIFFLYRNQHPLNSALLFLFLRNTNRKFYRWSTYIPLIIFSLAKCSTFFIIFYGDLFFA